MIAGYKDDKVVETQDEKLTRRLRRESEKTKKKFKSNKEARWDDADYEPEY